MPPSIATPLSSLTARELYGVRAQTPAGVVPFGYTGHAEDPTGLTWGRARCYAPRTGGWTGEDPVFTEPRYAYVGGRPDWMIDQDGRAAHFEYALIKKSIACAIGFGFAGAVVGLFGGHGAVGAVGAAGACGYSIKLAYAGPAFGFTINLAIQNGLLSLHD